MTQQVPVTVTKVMIGTSATDKTELTAIEYAGDRIMGSGAGGDHVTPLVVPNTTQPIGVIHHHKFIEIVIGLNEDEYDMLFTQNVNGTSKAVSISGPNALIGYFAIEQQNQSGQKRKIIYETNKTIVQNVGQNKTTFGEVPSYVVELTLLSYGTRIVEAWA